MGGVAGALGGAYLAHRASVAADADRAEVLGRYAEAMSELDAVALRDEATAASQRSRRARALRTVGLGAAVAVHVVSILDVAAVHARRSGLVAVAPAEGGFTVRVRL